MDKRKLYQDMARVRQQIFAVTAVSGFLAVLIATFIGQGFDFYAAFRNSVLALIGFGFLGFLWGKYYEKIIEYPLIESYRRDAQERVDELKSSKGKRVLMDMDVNELKPGMISVNAVYNQDKAMLVREGARLTERMIQTLKDNGIKSIKIEGQVRENSSDDF